MRTERVWKLGEDYIPEKEHYKHLGILCDKYMTFDNRVAEAFRLWLVGCFRFNGPLRQYFSLYRAVSQREKEERKDR